MFSLHPQLAADTVVIGELPLSRVLLARERQYPWIILVPQREDLTEIYQLEAAAQQQLMAEITLLSRAMMDEFKADKMNVAALGNQVPQLHVHIIARFKTDTAWPGPVWGAVPARPYTDDALKSVVKRMQSLLKLIKTSVN